VFVDFRDIHPTIRLAAAEEVRADIRSTYDRYLARHGGVRARNPESDHHRITTARVLALETPWSRIVGS
jgi:hypothetical protein